MVDTEWEQNEKKIARIFNWLLRLDGDRTLYICGCVCMPF